MFKYFTIIRIICRLKKITKSKREEKVSIHDDDYVGTNSTSSEWR